MSRARSMQNLPPIARWSIYIALAVAFAIACAFLSHWQFGRNAERQSQLALVEQNYDQQPVPLAELVPDGASLDPLDEWRPVELRGRYEPAGQLLARNRAHGGSAAYEVLTPLRLDDGRVFIVNRGWVPPGADGSTAAQVPAPPAGEVRVIARLRADEALPNSGRGAPAGQIPTINLALIAETTGPATITAALGELESETPAATETPGALPQPTADPGPYLSYAVQWILFAVMGFVFIGYVIRTEIASRRGELGDGDERSDDDADAEASASAARAPHQPAPTAATTSTAASTSTTVKTRPRRLGGRRNDSDMREEDAILDAQDR